MPVSPGQSSSALDPIHTRQGQTSSIELEAFCRKFVPGYVGYLMGDEGDRIQFIPGASWLVNLDKSGGDGTHWTALRVSTGLHKTFLYVDSLGYPCPKSISKKARELRCAVICSSEKLQKSGDESCGQRSINALERMAKKDDYKEFLRLMDRGYPIIRG